MLEVLVEGMRKVVRGLGIILMDILSEVDPEVFGSLEKSKNENEKQNLIFEASSDKNMPIKDENNTSWDDGSWDDEFWTTDYLYGLWGLPFNNALYWYCLFHDDSHDD